MKNLLIILLVLVLLGLGIGFYIKSDDEATGNLIIGLSVSVIFFFLMPLFIYHRSKKRKLQDYMLSKENMNKMRDFQKEKKI